MKKEYIIYPIIILIVIISAIIGVGIKLKQIDTINTSAEKIQEINLQIRILDTRIDRLEAIVRRIIDTERTEAVKQIMEDAEFLKYLENLSEYEEIEEKSYEDHVSDYWYNLTKDPTLLRKNQ